MKDPKENAANKKPPKKGRAAPSAAQITRQSADIARYHHEAAERTMQATRHYSLAAKKFTASLAQSAAADTLRKEANEHLNLADDQLKASQGSNFAADVDENNEPVSKTISESQFKHCMLGKLGNPPMGWATKIAKPYPGIGAGGLYHVWYTCSSCFPLMSWPDVRDEAIDTLAQFAQFVEQFYRDNGGRVVP
jgi:hypothetical protein